MLTNGEVHACLGNGLIGLPAASAGYGHAAGDVPPVDYQVHRTTTGVSRGYAEVDIVRAWSRDVYGVLFPLASVRPADVVAASRVAAVFQVNPLSSAEGRVGVVVHGMGHVMVGYAFPARVEIRSEDSARYIRRCPAIG